MPDSRAPDRTGLWLTSRAGEATRVTRAGAQPEDGALAPLAGAVLVYRGRAVLWAQHLAAGERPGEPAVVGRATGAGRVAARGDRFWVAWETDGAVSVRAGTCAPDQHQ